jgi:hypothetical protein
MSDILGQDLATQLNQTASTIGRLAATPASFTAALNAFRAQNGAAFLAELTRVRGQLLCEEICRWFSSKECVLECITFCGLPTTDVTATQIPAFAQAIARITADPALTQQLADIFDKKDAAGFKAFIAKNQLGPFCHLLCSWVCAVRFRLVCTIICEHTPVPGAAPKSPLAAALATAGAAIARLAKNPTGLQTVISAAVALNCEILNGIFGNFSDCIFLCEWICSWHCVLVCLPLCRQFPPLAVTTDAEIQAFGQFVGQLAANATAFPKLVAAVQTQDVAGYTAIINQFKGQQFCLQLCHWLCYEICRLFCFCVCPEPQTIPVFTHVGQYQVDPLAGDFQANGTTNVGGLAFTSTTDLKGILPTPDTNLAHQIEYRFTFKLLPAGPVTPVTGAMIPPSVIGQLEYFEFVGGIWVFKWADVWVNNPIPPLSIQQQIGPPLTVPITVTADVNGWIQEPWLDDFKDTGLGRFVPGGLLASLDTTKLTNEVFDLTVAAPPLPLLAGDPVPGPQQSVKPVFQLNFEARKVVGKAPVGANSRPQIALSNTEYTYNLHPDWAGSTQKSAAVMSLDIVELKAGGGCNPLTTQLHALFTAYHPYLATLVVFIQGPLPLPPAVNPAIGANGLSISPPGGLPFATSGLKPCAYILWLQATLNLTKGYGPLGGTFEDWIAFCKD